MYRLFQLFPPDQLAAIQVGQVFGLWAFHLYWYLDWTKAVVGAAVTEAGHRRDASIPHPCR